jgi:hypothetical protein
MSYLPIAFINNKAPVSVKDFGAIGDGVADDTTAIQNAINSAVAAGGDVVFLPEGTYLTSAVLTIGGNNITLSGIFGSSIIKAKNGVDFQNILTATGRSNIKLSNLVFDANKTGRAGVATTVLECVRLVTCSDVTIENCTWKNTRGFGGATGVGMGLAEMTRLKISNCIAIDCGTGGFVGLQSDGTYISGNDITVTNYSAIRCLDHGLVFEKASNVVASNIVCTDCGGGVAFGNFSAGDVENLTLTNFVIGGTSTDISDCISIGLFGSPLGTGNLKNIRISNGQIDNRASNGFPAIAIYPQVPPSGVVAITGATNATPIVITANGHGYNDGYIINNFGVRGNKAANGQFKVANKTSNTFELHTLDDVPVAGSGVFVAGGGYTQPWGRLQGLTIENVNIQGGPTQGINLCNCDDVLISDCDITAGTTGGGCVQGQAYVTGVRVVNTRVRPQDIFGMYFDDGSSDIEVSNCRIEGRDGYTQWGLFFFGTSYDIRTNSNTITGNLLIDESGLGASTTTAPRAAKDISFRSALPATSNLGIWPLGHTIINTSGGSPFAWQVTTEGVAGVDAVFSASNEGISVRPLDSGDDAANVQTVLDNNIGYPIVLSPGTYNWETPCIIPSNSYIIASPGVRIITDIAGGDAANSAFKTVVGATGAATLLNGNVTVGADTIVVDSVSGISIGSIIRVASVANSPLRAYYTVRDIVSTTISLDRPLRFPFIDNDTVTVVASVPERITFLGNGMTISGPAPLYFNFDGGARHCHLEDIIFDTEDGYVVDGIAALGYGSFDCSFERLFFDAGEDGSGMNAGFGLFGENNTFDRVVAIGITGTGGTAIKLGNCVGCAVIDCKGIKSRYGLGLTSDAGVGFPCYDNDIRGGIFDGNTEIGVYVQLAAHDNRFSGFSASDNSLYGVYELAANGCIDNVYTEFSAHRNDSIGVFIGTGNGGSIIKDAAVYDNYVNIQLDSDATLNNIKSKRHIFTGLAIRGNVVVAAADINVVGPASGATAGITIDTSSGGRFTLERSLITLSVASSLAIWHKVASTVILRDVIGTGTSCFGYFGPAAGTLEYLGHVDFSGCTTAPITVNATGTAAGMTIGTGNIKLDLRGETVVHYLTPAGDGSDDSLVVADALTDAAYIGKVVLGPGDWNWETKCLVPSGSWIEMSAGTRIISDVTITGTDPTDAIFFNLAGAQTNTGLTTTTVASGVDELSLDFQPSVGEDIIFGITGSLWAFSRVVTAVSGSGPYLVTVDKPIPKSLASGSYAITVVSVPRDIIINGNDALLTGPCERFIELGCAQNCLVESIRCDATEGFAVGYAVSFDVGGQNNEFRNIDIAGDGVVNTGLALESNEGSRIINCRATNAGHGILLLNDMYGRIIGANLLGCSSDGIAYTKDAVPDPGCFGTIVSDTNITGCSIGVLMTGGSTSCSFQGIVTGSANYGGFFDTCFRPVVKGEFLNCTNIAVTGTGVGFTANARDFDADVDTSGCDIGFLSSSGSAGVVALTSNENAANAMTANDVLIRRLRVSKASGAVTSCQLAGVHVQDAVISLPNGSIAINSFGTSLYESVKITTGGGGLGFQVLSGTARIAPSCDLSGATTAITLAGGAVILQQEAGKSTSKSLASGDVTLTVGEAQAVTLRATGAPGASRNLIVPTFDGMLWSISNEFSTAQNLTVKTAAGTGIVVTQGKTAWVRCDGTNVVTVRELDGTPTAFRDSSQAEILNVGLSSNEARITADPARDGLGLVANASGKYVALWANHASSLGVFFVGPTIHFWDAASVEAMNMSLVGNGATTLNFSSTVTSITISQADRTTNSATGATLTIQAQNATGTTSIGGNLVLQSGSGTSTSGYVKINQGTTELLQISYLAGFAYIQPVIGRSGLFFQNSAGGQIIQFAADTVAFFASSALYFGDNGNGLHIIDFPVSATGTGDIILATGLTAPSITQVDKTTNGGTGAHLTIQAQNETGTTSIGGNLVLKSGTGTSQDGYILGNGYPVHTGRNIIKTADQTISSSTLANDDTLTFAIGVNEKWVFEFVLAINLDANGGFKFEITAPSGFAASQVLYGYADGFGSVSTTLNTSTPDAGISTANADTYLRIVGSIVNGANAGSITLQFAENSGGGGATVKAASYVKANRSA